MIKRQDKQTNFCRKIMSDCDKDKFILAEKFAVTEIKYKDNDN